MGQHLRQRGLTASQSHQDAAPLRVLVAEDEYWLAAELAEHLDKLGAVVLGPAARLQTVAAIIDTEPQIDLALLDIKLRDGEVYPVADALMVRGIPVVFISGYPRSALPARYAAVPLLEKPFTLAELTQTLAAIRTV